jgi:uncharacterized protein
VNYLLDVNLLVAWGWSDHTDHLRAARWIGTILKSRSHTLLTSAIPQLGFVRVSVQRSSGQVTPELAGETLESMIRALGRHHAFLPDDATSTQWPAWCQSAARTTDAHLLSLAQAHGAELATLDASIPGAFLVP